MPLDYEEQWTAQSQKFVIFELNQNSRFEFKSNLEALRVPSFVFHLLLVAR